VARASVMKSATVVGHPRMPVFNGLSQWGATDPPVLLRRGVDFGGAAQLSSPDEPARVRSRSAEPARACSGTAVRPEYQPVR
jgi:hypothetical protein